MPGLNLGGMAGVKATGQASYMGAGSATSAAFGPGGSPSAAAPVDTGLTNANPTAVVFYFGVASILILLLIRHSLPEG